MATVVRLFDAATGTAYDFIDSTSPTFTGYRLQSYTQGTPANGIAIDTIVCSIHGTSVVNSLAMLRGLKSALAYAAQVINSGNPAGPSYVSFTPPGSAVASHCVLYGGTVQEPAADALVPKFIISDVVVMIRREPYWRKFLPAFSSSLSAWSTPVLTESSVFSHGIQAVSGVPGDMPALAHIKLGPTAASGWPMTRVVMAYTSQALNPIGYNAWGLVEAENGNLWTATVGSDLAANNAWAVQTAAPGTYLRRVSLTINEIGGAYRMFARMCVSAAATTWYVNSFAENQTYGAWTSPTINGTDNGYIAVTSTSYQVYDLGVLRWPNWSVSFDQFSAWQVETGISAGRQLGAGELRIDWFYLMPVHEWYLVADTTRGSETRFVYDNIAPTPRRVDGSWEVSALRPIARTSLRTARGVLRMPPGAGVFHWLTTDSPLETAPNHRLTIAYSPLYHNAPGA